jgi:hypothetical protein
MVARLGRPDRSAGIAIGITLGLACSMVFRLGPSVQLPLALAFAAWVPGSAFAAWMPSLSHAERRGVSVTLSLAATVLGSTGLVWLGWWHPGVLFVVLGTLSCAALLLSPSRSIAPTTPSERLPAPVAALFGVSAVAGLVTLWQLSDHDHIAGRWGLVADLPVAWFIAVAALVVGAAVAFRAGSRVGMAGGAALLVVLLHAPAVFAYAVPRFPWTYKHLAVTDFLLDHGRLQSGVDIYHNWPGFFSGAGFVLDLGGVREPLTLLRWWPLLIGLAAVAVLRFFFGALTDEPRVLWGAVTLFVVANWFGQDYFAPQSVAFLLGFGTLALLLRTSASAERAAFVVGKRERQVAAFAGIASFTAVVVTHQLSPYLLLPGITVACLLGAIRPRWLFVVCAAITLLYLLPRLGWVDSHGGIGQSSLGDNVRTPSSALAGEAGSVRVSAWASRLLTGGLALGSIPYLLRLRRDRWWTIFLVGNVVGPVCALAFQAYGNEGLLRSALFVTPWLAFAMAAGLATGPWSRPEGRHRAWVWAGALVAGVALFVTATWALDARYRVDPAEVRLVRVFERSAPRGSLLAEIGPAHLPMRLTSRYTQFTFHSEAPLRTTRDVDLVLARMEAVAARVSRRQLVYVASSASADRLAPLVGYGASADYAELRGRLRTSGRWTVIFDEGETLLVRFAG